jgi:serine/threonine protein kinase
MNAFSSVGSESNLPTKKRKLNRDLCCLQITGQVGSGMYGTVFKATDPLSGNQVALKCIKMTKENDGFPVTAVREIKLLKAMNHENIIALHEIVTYSRSKGIRPLLGPPHLVQIQEIVPLVSTKGRSLWSSSIWISISLVYLPIPKWFAFFFTSPSAKTLLSSSCPRM